MTQPAEQHSQPTFTRGPAETKQWADNHWTVQSGIKVIATLVSGETPYQPDYAELAANAALQAAAHNAATTVEDMGFNGQAAVEALPKLLDAADRLIGEVRACWGMEEPLLRQQLGNTNYQIVSDRLEIALLLLASCRAKESTS